MKLASLVSLMPLSVPLSLPSSKALLMDAPFTPRRVSSLVSLRMAPHSSDHLDAVSPSETPRAEKRGVDRFKHQVAYLNTPESFAQIFQPLQKRLHWFSRGDFLNLSMIGLMSDPNIRARFDAEGIPRRDLRSILVDLLNAPDKPIAVPVNQQDKQSLISMNADQAQQIASEMQTLMHQSQGIDLNRVVLDERFLWIPPGITSDQLRQEWVEHAGELGWSIIQTMTKHLPIGPIFSGSEAQSLTEGMLLDLRHWSSQYLNAAIRLLDIKGVLAELDVEVHMEKGLPSLLHNAYQRIQGVLQQQLDQGKLGQYLLRTAAARLIDNQVVSHLLAQFHQAGVSSAYSERYAVQADIAQQLRYSGATQEVLKVADALESGVIDLQLLSNEDFRDVTLDFYGVDLSKQLGGFSLGAQIFVLDPFQCSSIKGASLPVDLLSFVVHESIHALDWLKEPKRFDDYGSDALATYALERHAFIQQKLFLKGYPTDNINHLSRSGLSLASQGYTEMRAMIMERYQLQLGSHWPPGF